MSPIIKWRLGEKLNKRETSELIQELFNNARKHFVFNATTKIDKNLYELFENFTQSENSNCCLKFSSIETDLPFVSFEKFSDCVYEINSEYGPIFLHEKSDLYRERENIY
jgi:hypothetical protein